MDELTAKKLTEHLEKNRVISNDKESVLVSQMKFDALAKLADPKSDIFSQVTIEETHIFEVATLFAHDPCPNINSRLSAKLKNMGVADGEITNILITLPVLEEYIYGLLAHRIRIDRKRVREYIDGMEAITPKMGDVAVKPNTNTLLERLR